MLLNQTSMLSGLDLYKALDQMVSKDPHHRLAGFLYHHKEEIIHTNGIYIGDDSGNTALILAVEDGDIESAKFLMENTTQLNLDNEDGWTPIFLAISNDDLKMVRVLLGDNKSPDGSIVDLKHQDHDGNTPLHVAVQYGIVEMIDLLSSRMTDLNIRNHRGRTALESTQDQEIQQILIKHGATQPITTIPKFNYEAAQSASNFDPFTMINPYSSDKFDPIAIINSYGSLTNSSATLPLP